MYPKVLLDNIILYFINYINIILYKEYNLSEYKKQL